MGATDKEKLKALRLERAAFVDQAKSNIKAGNQLIQKIRAQIKDQAMTIPQIARAVQEPSSRVLLYVAGLKKFGIVVEREKEGDYFKYQLAAEK